MHTLAWTYLIFTLKNGVMAKVKFSALVSEMRNKLNGSVFSKNRAGNYLRNKVTPVNPQTSFQTAVRSRFGTLSAGFRDLTASQVAAWNSASANFPVIDIFGDTKFLSGIQLYVRLNSNLEQAGQVSIANPPAPALAPTPGLVSVESDVSDGTITATFTEATVVAGQTLMIWATPPVSNGKSYVKNLFRSLGTFTITTNEADITAAYVARFGTLAVGQKTFYRAVYINNTSGQQSVPIEVSTVTVA
jgi:hypothetical protein